jgi:RNA polymerase sigma factor (sigma-70 family)
MITSAHTNDLPLLEGLRDGRADSIDLIYTTCYRQVRVMITNQTGTEDDAKDIFQDAMMALYRRLQDGDFALTCKLSSYLQVVCRNLWLYRLRSQPEMTTMEKIGNESVQLDNTVIEEITSIDQRNLMYKHFDALPEDCRKILTLFFDKVPMANIAAALKSTEAYIKKRKFLCKSRLVEQIKADPVYKELSND